MRSQASSQAEIPVFFGFSEGRWPRDATAPAPWHTAWHTGALTHYADGGIAHELRAFASLLALSQIPISRDRWSREPFAFDEGTRGAFSRLDAVASDALVVATVAVPVVTEAAAARPDPFPKGVVYVETLAVGLVVNAASKYIVQRPRPYTYSLDPKAVAHRQQQGKDAHVSFYSGHATAAFAAAVAGSTLYAYGNPNEGARAALWGVEMALASATAVERVRAGKHFPSDVIVGACVGSAIGDVSVRAS